MNNRIVQTLQAENETAEIKLAAEQKAAREKTLADYYRLISNPGRNTPKDRELLGGYMESLGKKLADVQQDVRMVEWVREHFAEAIKLGPAHEASEKARLEFEHFKTVKRAEMEAAIQAEESQLERAHQDARDARKAASDAAHTFRSFLRDEPWLAAFFPGFEGVGQLLGSYNLEEHFKAGADAAGAQSGPKPAA